MKVKVQTRLRINEDPKDAMLRQHEEEISRLKALLEQKKVKLQERSHIKQADETQMPIKVVKKRMSTPNKPIDTADKSLGMLLEEQKCMEEKHREELRALLEPYGINVDQSPKGIMDELERRKTALMKDGEEVKEENKRIYDELAQTTKAILDSKRQCKELFRKVLSLEEQIQKSKTTHDELKSKEKELMEQSLREATLRKTLEQKKLTANELKEELSKLQHEIEGKQKRITKFRCKIGEHKDKMQMLQVDHGENMKQLQILKKDLTRELMLKKMIVDNFVPRKIRKKTEDRIRYDDIEDKYILAPRTDTTFDRPPVNRMLVNPYLNLTRFTRLTKQSNIFYSNENLLAVEPEPPVPRSQELVLEEEDPAIANMIADTMRELNQELVIVCDHRKGRHKSSNIHD